MNVLPYSSRKSKRKIVKKTNRQNTCPQTALNNGHTYTLYCSHNYNSQWLNDVDLVHKVDFERQCVTSTCNYYFDIFIIHSDFPYVNFVAYCA